MMTHRLPRNALVAFAIASIALVGCGRYVKRDEFNATVAELRAADQQLMSQLQALSDKHDALVTRVAGRIRVDTLAYFEFDRADLDEQAKPLLDDFAEAIRSGHGSAVVTVEGFADPAGSRAYNKRLGKRRADAVRDYLVGTAGLSATQVRAVSYGEDADRQVRPGATGDAGRDNRRVVLVIDHAGPNTTAAM